MKLTGGEAIMESLIAEGVDLVFGYPGGAIMPTYDAIYKYKNKIRHILVRHEQGASHAAEGYAYVTNKPGVVIATSGPGATNLVTGIADAMLDSVPLVCITGQVHASLVGTDAFQEVDVIGVTTPITKWNYQVTSATEIPKVLAKAFHIARTGRPGPVVIDITKNAQIESFEFEYPKNISLQSYQPTIKPNMKQIRMAADLLNSAKRPYMLIGHGVLISQAEEEVKKVAKILDIPVASTLLGLSSMPVDFPQYVGFLGMHGNYGTNLLTNKADVIFAVGMRFDDRVTGNLSKYAPNAKLVHIDIDPAELNKNVKAEIPIVADAKHALQELLPYLKKQKNTAWINQFKACDKQEKEKVIEAEIHPKSGAIKMAEAIHLLSEMTKGEAVIVTDVGQHQMKTARYYRYKKPRSSISSGGAGTMGYGVPAAVGAKLGAPERDVIAIVGDGGFQMTLQELGTIAQEKLPVKIVILNNHYLGMVRQWQQLFFDNRYSFVNIGQPNFVKVAQAYDIKAEKITKREELKAAYNRMLKTNEPYLLDIDVEKEENVFPMVESGASVEDVRLE